MLRNQKYLADVPISRPGAFGCTVEVTGENRCWEWIKLEGKGKYRMGL